MIIARLSGPQGMAFGPHCVSILVLLAGDLALPADMQIVDTANAELDFTGVPVNDLARTLEQRLRNTVDAWERTVGTQPRPTCPQHLVFNTLPASLFDADGQVAVKAIFDGVDGFRKGYDDGAAPITSIYFVAPTQAVLDQFSRFFAEIKDELELLEEGPVARRDA